LGLLRSSIAIIRAAIFPRWSGILPLVAALGFFFDFFVADFLPAIAGQVGAGFLGLAISVALAWIGVSMWIAWDNDGLAPTRSLRHKEPAIPVNGCGKNGGVCTWRKAPSAPDDRPIYE
jgi:hypothetical protein